jgi:putative nucleotidyltransferase with HDIG domain
MPATQEPVALADTGELAPRRAGSARGGTRLVSAFEDVATFPALRMSTEAMVAAIADESAGRSTITAVVESDPALLLAVLRTAGREMPRNRPVTAADAIAALSNAQLQAVADEVPVFDFFEQSRPWSDTAERFRVHARTTQTATESIRRALGLGPRPDLRVAALLHDIGKLVLLRAYGRYELIWDMRASPDDRLKLESSELGIDHALVGGVLARRLGLADSLARTIERHHRDDDTGDAAILRVADMLAHYAAGGVVQGTVLAAAASTIGLSTDGLRGALDELPAGTASEARCAIPSPLTRRETDMMQGLAAGKVYKQIAVDLDLAVSTVRTHLYNAYRKLGVVDRAQAVLLATANGWL